MERRIADSQTTLKKIIGKWELSGRGDGEHNDDDDEEPLQDGQAGFGHNLERFEFRAGNNRSKFLHIEGKERKPDLLYFWHLMDSNEILDAALDIIDLSVGGDSASAPLAAGPKTSTMAKRKQHKDKLNTGERKRIAKQAEFQKKMSKSMQDLARSSITETRMAGLKEYSTIQLRLSALISDPEARAEVAFLKQYLAAIRKELDLPEESKNAESEGSLSEESDMDMQH